MSLTPTNNPSTAPTDSHAMETAVRRLAESIVNDQRIRHVTSRSLPDREVIIHVLNQLIALMFPGFFGARNVSLENIHRHVDEVLRDVSASLTHQIAGAIQYQSDTSTRTSAGDEVEPRILRTAGHVVADFIARLPEIRSRLSLDVQAAYDGDPAAHHTDETIICYPGVFALSVHRLANELYRLDVPLIPRIMSEHAHFETGIDIHPGARIGKSFFIDHGTGVVIGETTDIGDHCKIYQGVTLGAKSFPKDERGQFDRRIKRHPTLEDHVTVYAGATILGGDTVIGAGSVVNGGVFLTKSVPPGHVVRAPKVELTLRSNPELPPGMYNI